MHAWVIEYRITHRALALAIHEGTFPAYTELICGGCVYFSGEFEGGPYQFRLEKELWRGSPIVALIGNDGEFVVRAEAFKIAEERRPGSVRPHNA